MHFSYFLLWTFISCLSSRVGAETTRHLVQNHDVLVRGRGRREGGSSKAPLTPQFSEATGHQRERASFVRDTARGMVFQRETAILQFCIRNTSHLKLRGYYETISSWCSFVRVVFMRLFLYEIARRKYDKSGRKMITAWSIDLWLMALTGWR